MMPPVPKRRLPSPTLVAWYNAVPNVLWSALSFVPLCIYCYQAVARPWLYGFGAVSLLACCLPTAWYRYGQLSAGPAAYRRLGVPVVGRLAQHGALVNGLLRWRYPSYRYLPSRAALASLVRTSYQQERFHWAGLVFFLLVNGYAVARAHIGWAALLLLLNAGYNLYPIWLQQYLRVRLRPGQP
ncbi:hypothetical protein GO988_18485 [Hymenobacter sp. HMF4947]|uniref:Glycosyl-4,4'-diaponeurosporenoate acyltransferase n=1 Tax=Hymenobacter ginkgonis TaxID=2682976 RepID=A0A7K1TIX2_9BACT|nr:hypothetical protein [Hymenobacter ginkgonis]MVN78322.1 hypothetical protein [Hymenobacter ginkgonis]